MSRLFFDIVAPNVRQFDFSGASYAGLEQDRAAAELLSIDLGCAVDTPRIGAAAVQLPGPEPARGGLTASSASGGTMAVTAVQAY